MKIVRLNISNFRGIKSAQLLFDGHTLIVGSNNVGKSTLCEALDLVLGPDRLNRFPPVDEFDFYNAEYLAPAAEEGASAHRSRFESRLSSSNLAPKSMPSVGATSSFGIWPSSGSWGRGKLPPPIRPMSSLASESKPSANTIPRRMSSRPGPTSRTARTRRLAS
jgi:energy-coupling factor transporter ATP-binding protein EcfA2